MSVVEFTEQFLKVRDENTESPKSIVLDHLMSELSESLIGPYEGIIARYPRRFGKTTTILGYVLMSLLERRKHIGYSAGVYVRSMRFLQSTAYAYRCLPKGMRNIDCTESPDRFRVNESMVEIPKSSLWTQACEYQAMIYDDYQKNDRFQDMVNQRGKTVIVGTFPLNSELGRVWVSPPRNWISLPQPAQQWQVNTILSFCDPMFSKGY